MGEVSCATLMQKYYTLVNYLAINALRPAMKGKTGSSLGSVSSGRLRKSARGSHSALAMRASLSGLRAFVPNPCAIYNRADSPVPAGNSAYDSIEEENQNETTFHAQSGYHQPYQELLNTNPNTHCYLQVIGHNHNTTLNFAIHATK